MHDLECKSRTGKQARVRVWYGYKTSVGAVVVDSAQIHGITGTVTRTEPYQWVMPYGYEGNYIDYRDLREFEEVQDNIGAGGVYYRPATGYRELAYDDYYDVYNVHRDPLLKFDFFFTDGSSCATHWRNSQTVRKL